MMLTQIPMYEMCIYIAKIIFSPSNKQIKPLIKTLNAILFGTAAKDDKLAVFNWNQIRTCEQCHEAQSQ